MIAIQHGARALLLVVACLLLAASTPAAAPQRPVRASATLSTGVLKYGATATLTVEVEDQPDAKLLPASALDGLRISAPGQPMVSSFQSVIGGRRLAKTTLKWSLVVEPEREGSFELPPLIVEAGGRRVEVPVQPATLKVVRDIQGADLGFLEVQGVPSRVYEGQPFTVDLRAGWDGKLQVATAGLLLPWWGRLSGVLDLTPEDAGAGRKVVQLGLNRTGRIQMFTGEEERNGTPFVTVQNTRRMMATRPGTLEFPESVFEFGELVGNAGPFGQRRTRDFYAVLPRFDVEVLRVPEEGRPFEWGGAVGSVVAERTVEGRDVDQGGSLEFAVRWTGDANLEFFDLPDLARLDAFRGFRVLGVEDTPGVDERRAVWELVPLDATLTEIPALPLSVFDPELEDYTTVATEPVPIRVRAVEGGLDPALGGPTLDGPDLTGIDPRPRPMQEPQEGPGGGALLGGYALVGLGWLVGRTRLRRLGDPDAPEARRRRRAPRALARDLAAARTASEQRSALATYLGARSGETAHAWIGRPRAEFRDRAGDHLAPEAAEALASQLQALDVAVHAQDDAAVDPAPLQALAARLRKEGL